MASSSQIRAWWAKYKCDTLKYVRVSFPGDGRDWDLYVADQSAPIWRAVAQIMASEPYLFREVAGGTYNCRPPSLHAYGLALDLNPRKNPFQNPPVYDYPETFIKRMEGIRANGKQAIMWGGRFPADNPPDTMHWQINVAPADCKNVEWDQGTPVPPPIREDDLPPISAASHVESIRYAQRLLGVATSGEWDTATVEAVKELATRSGTGDPVGKSGTHINGVMFDTLETEKIRRVAGGGGGGLQRGDQVTLT